MDDEPGASKDSSNSKKVPTNVFEIPDDIRKPPSEEAVDPNEDFIESLQSTEPDRDPSPKVPDSKEENKEYVPSVTGATEKSPDNSLPVSDTSKNITEPTDEKHEVSFEAKPHSETPAALKGKDEETSKEEKDEESETAEAKSKPSYFKKKRTSIVTFLTGKSPGEGDDDDDKKEEKRKPTKRRPSFVRRKIIAFEKELTMDNINKTVTSIFVPDSLKDDDESEEEVTEEEIKPKRVHLSSAMACVFLVSATTGSAIASLPYYLKQSSWYGVFLIILLGFNSMYGGLCTGWCWNILEEKWPEYLEYSRIPYQDIAFRAVGRWMKYIVAICVDVTIFGSCAGYTLLIADSVENVAFKYFNFCITLIILSCIFLPIMMFGSYRNIKLIGILDVLLSVLFTLLLVISFFLDRPMRKTSIYSNPSFQSVMMAFAGFSFAYGSGAVLPSIMSDMADREMFTHTCATAYMIVVALYILQSVMGYAAYADQTPRYILQNILTNKYYYILGIVIDVMYVLQLATTYVIALFPILHSFEVRVNCSDQFGCCRVLVRLTILLCILAIILGVPSIDKLMDLVGATTMNLLTFIFPPIFYVCLVRQFPQKRHISKKEWLLIVETVLLGILVGAVSTYVSLGDYTTAPSGRLPCYLNITAIPETKAWIMQPMS